MHANILWYYMHTRIQVGRQTSASGESNLTMHGQAEIKPQQWAIGDSN